MRARRKPATVKVIPLGGVGEIGLNCTLIETEEEMIIIDAGLMFPEEDMPGVDIVIPDFTYIKTNKEKVKGLFLTHGHEDHIGAIPYLLRGLPEIPVYGGPLTMAFVNARLKEQGMALGEAGHTVAAGDIIQVGSLKVEFITVCHSIADSFGLAISTKAGLILHTGDFKIDQTPIDGKRMDLSRFAQLGGQGVMLMMSDSTNAVNPGYTGSESIVGEGLLEAFRAAEGRVLVATFASHVARIQQVLQAAAATGRKVAFAGRSLLTNSKIAMELGYLKPYPGVMIELSQVDDLPDNEVVIMTTGTQGEPTSALTRMAMSEFKRTSIKKGDTVIISASTIPGNEKSVFRTVNHLYRQGAEVIGRKDANIHVSGHASQEELKLLLALVKPKHFTPVHGEYNHLHNHAKLAMRMGMDKSKVLIAGSGEIIEIKGGKARLDGHVQAGRVMVDGYGVGDVGKYVLRDRMLLSNDGILVAVVVIDKETGELLRGPEIISRGFVYEKESEALFDEVTAQCRKVLSRQRDVGAAAVAETLRGSIVSVLSQRTGRKPLIIPHVLEL
ncbi:MAG TPA: ribonuclease J [Bacillota bacterium]|nr:ribonuclease J [Bacillota bacterium]HOH10578.1 ribonuclease J [Bacillota bacterium]HOY89545.1 ribonuclease J [Bacillota bacterium]HPI01947.1 ribonuclease J [Bacillota bacterium]HPM63627.1 ribonuclease J [Bacillota bacterium]